MLIAIMTMVTGAKAQTFLQERFINNNYSGSFANYFQLDDSSSSKKWSVNRYSAISSSFMFFKGGNASMIAAPIGLQINRRLNNNLYAFANVTLEPAYVNFNRSFIANGFGKENHNNNLFKPGNLGLYSRAALGLQYVNDERTFSISGSIGIERSTYPIFPYNQMNTPGTNHLMPLNNKNAR